MPRPVGRDPVLPPLPATVTTTSEAETESLGAALGALLGPGDVVALTGPLGAGKTCLARGITRGLGAAERAASPSFTLVREYPGRLPVRHVDLYRLERADLADLGWRELFHGQGVAVVEWADRAWDLLPERRYEVDVAFDPSGDRTRRVITLTLRGGEREAVTPGHPYPCGAGPVRSSRPVPAPAAWPARVFAIETSTGARSLAAVNSGRLEELFWEPAPDAYPAEDLSASIREALGLAGLTPRDLELIAVALGPGSFTGVRVGLAAAKALAWALGVPLKGVGTLDVLARTARRRAAASVGTPVLVLVDARRGEVFGAAYDRDADPLPIPAVGGDCYVVGEPARVTSWLLDALAARGGSPPREVLPVGDGFALHRPEVAGALARASVGAPPEPAAAYPGAGDLALLAAERLTTRGPDDPMVLAPLYLRDPAITAPRGPVGGPGEPAAGRCGRGQQDSASPRGGRP
ncbi:MAG: tRNA (adenosine(37)-N6)-threonylcarbamoyltransferase complex dimerization subunit type 1 TsaB [Firmicutes bacterium]|nr:tRNA (adenosine(37)-N6)-threonylcarbamoyltransferase complex dimerization subunit type 1 TsaB [Bacillota bacterium]